MSKSKNKIIDQIYMSIKYMVGRPIPYPLESCYRKNLNLLLELSTKSFMKIRNNYEHGPEMSPQALEEGLW